MAEVLSRRRLFHNDGNNVFIQRWR